MARQIHLKHNPDEVKTKSLPIPLIKAKIDVKLSD